MIWLPQEIFWGRFSLIEWICQEWLPLTCTNDVRVQIKMLDRCRRLPVTPGCEAVCTNGRKMVLLHCWATEEPQFQEKVKCLTCNGLAITWRLLTGPSLGDCSLPGWQADIAQRRPRILNFRAIGKHQRSKNCIFEVFGRLPLPL